MEVWAQDVSIVAESKQEAIARVAEGDGDLMVGEGHHRFMSSMDTDFWAAEETVMESNRELDE